ncbi:hypothetical protein AB9F45_37655, partial [Rhizobium leguminosarum]
GFGEIVVGAAVKPFEIAELEARIRAVVRRGQDRASYEITVGNLRFSGGTRQFFVAGELLQLTPREYAVLEQIVMKLGNTVSKA